MSNKSSPISIKCPCGSDKAYAACCGQCHTGQPAPNAEALMRSRYSAYVLQLEDYLLQTWHPDKRPAALGLADEKQPKWLGLEIKRFESTSGNTAIVEFVARYKINGKAKKLHEISRFVEIDGQWYYVDGQLFH